ncbi:hypothetical protein MP638_005848 [Amoeboaphelidium occidentale]|nr:hypothetical protein MP638_005848 [Amoeboaphelidium occidentale]
MSNNQPQLLVYYVLANPDGSIFGNFVSDFVTMLPTAVIGHVRDAVKIKNADGLLRGISPGTLTVYKDKAALEAKTFIDDEELVCEVWKPGMKKKDALWVLVPPVSSPTNINAGLGIADVPSAPQSLFIAALESMAGAKECVDSETGARYLEFKAFNFIDGRCFEKLMIRDSYVDLLVNTGIMVLPNDEQQGVYRFNERKFVSILGTPGIGKSMMLFYATYFFHVCGATVFYRHYLYPQIYFMLDPESGKARPVNDLLTVKGKYVAFYDSVPGPAVGDVVISATSPRRMEIINEFKKAKDHQSAYLPPWTKLEFDHLFKVCINGKAVSDMSADAELTDLVDKVKSPGEILKYSGTSWEDPPKVFHDLLHMLPDSSLKRYVYHSASLSVTKKLFNAAKDAEFVNLAAAINFTRQNHANVVSGDLFEIFALEILRKGGTFKRRNLSTGVIDTVIIHPGKLILTKCYDISGAAGKNFYVSTRLNEPAVDFVAHGHLMNTTISTSHDFKVNSTNVDWMAKLHEGTDWDICLVVPEDIIDSCFEVNVVAKIDPFSAISPRNTRAQKRVAAEKSEELGTARNEKNDLIKKVCEHVQSLDQYAIAIPILNQKETLASSSTSSISTQMENVKLNDEIAP